MEKHDVTEVRRCVKRAIRHHSTGEKWTELEARISDMIPILQEQLKLNSLSDSVPKVNVALGRLLARQGDMGATLDDLESTLGGLSRNHVRIGTTIDSQVRRSFIRAKTLTSRCRPSARSKTRRWRERLTSSRPSLALIGRGTSHRLPRRTTRCLLNGWTRHELDALGLVPLHPYSMRGEASFVILEPHLDPGMHGVRPARDIGCLVRRFRL